MTRGGFIALPHACRGPRSAPCARLVVRGRDDRRATRGAAGPPVAAPRPAPLLRQARPAGMPVVSERARSLLGAAAVRVLEEAAAFDVPVAATESTFVDERTGATVMAPLIVRGTALTESQVRPPDLRLLHFERARGDKHRRIAGGVTAPLYQTFIGQKELLIDFSILNGAGNGVDHQIDFTRAEIAFRLKW
jgi:hypothetical protein